MSSSGAAFFRFVGVTVVRRVKKGSPYEIELNGIMGVREMLIQITLDYPGLPDPRTLTLYQIQFFYEGLRPGMLEQHGG